jgi:hypothetical protein
VENSWRIFFPLKPWEKTCFPEQPKIQITVQQIIICLLPNSGKYSEKKKKKNT